MYAQAILVRLWASSFYSPLLKLFISPKKKKKKKKTLKPSIPYISKKERWMVVCLYLNHYTTLGVNTKNTFFFFFMWIIPKYI